MTSNQKLKGQGTRLGSEDPKGMFNVNLPSSKSLFQLQAERLLKLVDLAKENSKKNEKVIIKWYIMTSEATHNQSIKYFESNNHFGLKKENIKFFKQLNIPALSFDGKLLLEKKNKIVRSPNGNGGIFFFSFNNCFPKFFLKGIYSAMEKNGILEEMKKGGIELAFLYGVDNIAIKMCDPVFLGLLAENNLKNGSDVCIKTTPKLYPQERVGVVAYKNNVPSIVEYRFQNKKKKS